MGEILREFWFIADAINVVLIVMAFIRGRPMLATAGAVGLMLRASWLFVGFPLAAVLMTAPIRSDLDVGDDELFDDDDHTEDAVEEPAVDAELAGHALFARMFVLRSRRRGIIDDRTHDRLLEFLDDLTSPELKPSAAPAPPVSPTGSPSSAPPATVPTRVPDPMSGAVVPPPTDAPVPPDTVPEPAPASEPEAATHVAHLETTDVAQPGETPVDDLVATPASTVRSRPRPPVAAAQSRVSVTADVPAPPERERPNWLTDVSDSWKSVRSDLALHGFAYLGVLMTVLAVIGFMFFAFADVPNEAQPFAELFIAVVFFGWAWFLRRLGARYVATAMELVGGMTLPLVVFAGFVDEAPFPPDVRGTALIVVMVASSLTLAVLYHLVARRFAWSSLRYLVAPLVWLGAFTAGFVMKNDEPLVRDAITRLVSLQPALALVAMAATLVVLRRRRSAGTTAAMRAALVAGPVAGLIQVSLSVAEGWDPTWTSFVGALAGWLVTEQLMAWFDRRDLRWVVRPLFVALVMLSAVPMVGGAWAGLFGVAGFLWLLDRGIMSRASGAVAAASVGTVVSLVLTVGEPSALLSALIVLGAWGHFRRGTVGGSAVAVIPSMCAVFAPPAAVIVAAIEFRPDVVWFVASLLVATAAWVTRGRQRHDALWAGWLFVTAVGLGLAAVISWSISGGVFGGPSLMVLAVAVPAMSVPVISRVWAVLGMVSAATVLLTGSFGVPEVERWTMYAGMAALATTVAAGLRFVPMSHVGLAGLVAGGVVVVFAPYAAQAAAWAAWALGLSVSFRAGYLDGESVTRLLRRAGATVGRWLAATVPLAWAVAVPVAVISVANETATFMQHRSLTGVTLGVVAVAYAVLTRRVPPSGGRRIIAVFAPTLALVGIAVAVPGPEASIAALGGLVAVTLVSARDVRPRWMVGVSWVAGGVMVVLTAERLGVAVAHLHLVGLVWAWVVTIGAIAVDRRTPRRDPASRWTQWPLFIGAVVAPACLGIVFAQDAATQGWWVLATAVWYGVVAVMLGAGSVTGPAYFLAVVAWGAFTDWRYLDQPYWLVGAGALLLAAGWVAERSVQARFLAWMRWDLPLVVVGYLAVGLALVLSLLDGEMAPTMYSAAVVAIGLAWSQRRAEWVVAAQALTMLGGVDLGGGWLVLSAGLVTVTSMALVPAAIGDRRLVHHIVGLGSLLVAWAALFLWVGMSATALLAWSSILAGTVGLVTAVGYLARRLADDTALIWGGAALVGATVTTLESFTPAGPGIEGAGVGIGLAMLAGVAEVLARRHRLARLGLFRPWRSPPWQWVGAMDGRPTPPWRRSCSPSVSPPLRSVSPLDCVTW